MLNDSIHYVNDALHVDSVALEAIAAATGTPTYVYSLRRALDNLARLRGAFAVFNPHIHYSAKANANLHVLRALIRAQVGVDAVSAGEIHRALAAGVDPARVVFAGVGKRPDEIDYAVRAGIGWFNVENVAEFDHIQRAAAQHGTRVKVAPRLNPDIRATTAADIATGHRDTKFGLMADVVRDVLARRADYPALDFAGIHVHIGSQLHDATATAAAIESALDLIAAHPDIRTINIGGGLAVPYTSDDPMPDWRRFANALPDRLIDYDVLMEPGRSIIADAGILLTRVLYVKRHGGQTFAIVDASMAELMRPALYDARHMIVPVKRQDSPPEPVQVVGAVCETTDTLGHAVPLSDPQAGDLLAILTAGAYGMVMANNYNARPRPAEVVVAADRVSWRISRQRETLDDLLRGETG